MGLKDVEVGSIWLVCGVDEVVVVVLVVVLVMLGGWVPQGLAEVSGG